jgi:hypothetical protein
MTVKEFQRTPHGTRVLWRWRPTDASDLGTVYRDHTKPRGEVRWDDGQTTDGGDEAALRYVERAPRS